MDLSYQLKIDKKYLAAALLFLIGSTAFALNPVPGWYAGITVGATYAAPMNFNFANPLTGTVTPARLVYSVFGNIAGQAGYRCNHYRFEGELMLNNNNYNNITVNGVKIDIASPFSTSIGQKGQTTTGAILFNAYYDLFSANGAETSGFSNFAPYVGLGIGYATIRNNIKFYSNDVYISGSSQSTKATSPAAQGIIGVNYFLDDFTTIGVDYRHFGTKSVAPFDAPVRLNSINITLNGAFDRS